VPAPTPVNRPSPRPASRRRTSFQYRQGGHDLSMGKQDRLTAEGADRRRDPARTRPESVFSGRANDEVDGDA